MMGEQRSGREKYDVVLLVRFATKKFSSPVPCPMMSVHRACKIVDKRQSILEKGSHFHNLSVVHRHTHTYSLTQIFPFHWSTASPLAAHTLAFAHTRRHSNFACIQFYLENVSPCVYGLLSSRWPVSLSNGVSVRVCKVYIISGMNSRAYFWRGEHRYMAAVYMMFAKFQPETKIVQEANNFTTQKTSFVCQSSTLNYFLAMKFFGFSLRTRVRSEPSVCPHVRIFIHFTDVFQLFFFLFLFCLFPCSSCSSLVLFFFQVIFFSASKYCIRRTAYMCARLAEA